MNRSTYLVFAIIFLFVGFVGVAVYVKNKTVDGGPLPTLTLDVSDWTKGTNTGVVLLEYGDFQCPACGQYYPIVSDLLKEVGPSITFAFRHLPLNQHKNAIPAALASEAAGKQGKFWDMYHVLYVNQSDWSELSDPTEIFKTYAKNLSLDLTRFETDSKDPAIKSKITASYKAGIKLGVEGTPSFFLNGVKIKSPGSLEEFKLVVKEAIAKQKTTTSTVVQ